MTKINVNAPLEIDVGGVTRRATADDLRGPRGLTGYDTAPIGSIVGWTAAAIPAGWALANGQRFTQAAYSDAYNFATAQQTAGNPHWTARTSDHTFTVPNLTDKFLLGAGAKALGATGGEENHTLTTPETPSHTHSATVTDGQSSSGTPGSVDASGAAGEHLPLARRNDVGFYNTIGVTLSNTGGGGAHNNMPPYVALGWIVKLQGAPVGTPTDGPPLGFTSVLQFGVDNTGTVDSSAAIATADAASPFLWWPKGTYLAKDLSLTTSGSSERSWMGAGNRLSILKLPNGANTNILSVAAGVTLHASNLGFDGNKANNSSGHCIILPASTGYQTGARLFRCRFQNAAEDNLNVGLARNDGKLTECSLGGAGNDNVHLDGADWTMVATENGTAGRDNLWCDNAAGTHWFGGTLTGAGRYDCSTTWKTRGIHIEGADIDSAQQHGLYLNGYSSGYAFEQLPDQHRIIGCQFFNNSHAATNTYSDIFLWGVKGAQIEGNSFTYYGLSNTVPKYHIEDHSPAAVDGNESRQIVATGNNYRAVALGGASGKTTFGTAFTNVVDIVQQDAVKRGTTDVQVFTANGTWRKISGSKKVTVLCVGGGGGGGSGRRGAASTARYGGGGGGGGATSLREINAENLPDTVTVTVSATGANGGAAKTGDDLDGAAGSSGTHAIFGTYVRGSAGAGGGAGSATAGAAGAGGVGTSNGGGGGAASATIGGDASGSVIGSTGGGAGGTINASNTAYAGGAGSYPSTTPGASAAGGAVDAATPGTGYAQPANSGLPGQGGGGGAASITTVAQTGAAGTVYGGGGGGGGASLNGNNSGAGGAGGPGIVIVITSF